MLLFALYNMCTIEHQVEKINETTVTETVRKNSHLLRHISFKPLHNHLIEHTEMLSYDSKTMHKNCWVAEVAEVVGRLFWMLWWVIARYTGPEQVNEIYHSSRWQTKHNVLQLNEAHTGSVDQNTDCILPMPPSSFSGHQKKWDVFTSCKEMLRLQRRMTNDFVASCKWWCLHCLTRMKVWLLC